MATMSRNLELSPLFSTTYIGNEKPTIIPFCFWKYRSNQRQSQRRTAARLPGRCPRPHSLGVLGIELHRIEPSQCLTDRRHVMDTKDLNALQGQCARHADCRRRWVQRRTRLNIG